MTLEETIKHAEYIVNNRKYAISVCWSVKDCEQIAQWLKELAERRQRQPEIIRCKDCENWDTTWQNDSAPNYHYCPMMDGTYSGDFYCAKAERRTDATN